MESFGKLNVATNSVKEYINQCFDKKEPWQIVAITAGSVLTSVWVWDVIFQDESLLSRGKKLVFRLARKIPAIRNKIKTEMENVNTSFEESVIKRNEGVAYITSLPILGKQHDVIINDVKQYLSLGDFKWKEGYVSGAVYFQDQKLIDLLTQVYGLASYTNPLHPDIFPGVCKMEAEVVRMAATLFNGSSKACGTMTTGGTESILMACKAYRDHAKEEMGIKKPEIVLPITAHPAFNKASAYFGLKMNHVPVDPLTLKVDLKAMKRAIGRNTCVLVGSAPNYPYGTMDDIEEIAALGRQYNIPVHVDSCLGGFVAVFMKEAGFDIRPFDFSVPGVTSISADTHKYGFAPKGSSVILYSEPKYRHYQFHVATDWPGGVYGSPTVNGSRAGGIIAACWATMLHFGMEGYVSATKRIIETTKKIENGLRNMKGLFVFGKPATSVIAIGSKEFHIYRLSEALNKKGWNLNPLQFPCGIHLCVTHVHTADGVADRFLSDVEEELTEIMKDPDQEVHGHLAMYGMSQSIPDRSIVGDFTRFFLDSMYYTPKAKEEMNSNV